MTEEVSVVWQACLADLQYQLDETEFNHWFSVLKAVEAPPQLTIFAVNAFFVKTIKDRYLPLLQSLVEKHSQGQLTKIVLKPTVLQAEILLEPEPTANKKQSKTSIKLPDSDKINELYTFESFVKGKSNALAYNACLEMGKKAEQSGYSSIFIYGMSGVGKSHLMQSVAHRYKKNGKQFCFFEAKSFLDRLSEAFRDGKVPQFIKSVKQADLLIIDDVHLIPSKKKVATAGVLLDLYSDFVKSGKRVILASDKPPAQMEDFDARFLSRFSEGLTVAIDPPEIDTRLQILQKKATRLNLNLPKECAIFIAQNVPPDVRRLEGALNQVRANAQMMGAEVDLGLVRQAIKNLIVTRSRSINGDNIKDMVAEYYGISVKDLLGKKRSRNIARPRQLAMALTREFTNDSFPDIGQAFGGRDHSTVIHACEQVAKLVATDPVFEKDYNTLKSTLEFY